MKKLLIIVGIVLVVGVGLAAMSMHGHSINVTAATTTVRAEPVELGDLVEIVSAPGTVDSKSRVQISARVSARIIELPFAVGQTVTRGNPDARPPVPASVLVRLDSADLASDLRAAQAHYASQLAQIDVAQERLSAEESQLAATQVQVDDALRDLKRQQGLFATSDVSQGTVDTAQAKYDQLRNQLAGSRQTLEADRANLTVMKYDMEAADAATTRAKEALADTVITSPIDGTVTKVNGKVGQMDVSGTVDMNNPGTVLMEVADLRHMVVTTRVDESAVAQIQIGQHAKVHCAAYPDRIFEGTVQEIALSQTQEQDQGPQVMPFYECEIALDQKPDDRLFCGLSADVDVEVKRNRNVMTVPSQAVLDKRIDELPPEVRGAPEVDKSKTFTAAVFRLVDGKAMETPVSTGASDTTRTIITSGLKSGDMIVTGPFKVLQTLTQNEAVKQEAASTETATTKPAATGPG